MLGSDKIEATGNLRRIDELGRVLKTRTFLSAWHKVSSFFLLPLQAKR